MADLLSDALGRDKSSRLYIRLKKELNLVSEISAYVMGSLDDGLLLISGKLNNEITFEQLDEALWKVLVEIKETEMDEIELKRLLIKIRTAKEFQEQGLLNRAMNLCSFELLGDADGINQESLLYQAITSAHLKHIANDILVRENCSLLKIKASQND